MGPIFTPPVKNLHLLDLYGKLRNSSSESSTSSSCSSSEECTGRPQQLLVEEEKTLPDPAGSTSECEDGKEKVYFSVALPPRTKPVGW